MLMTAAHVVVVVVTLLSAPVPTPTPSLPPLPLLKFSSVFPGSVMNVVKTSQRSYR